MAVLIRRMDELRAAARDFMQRALAHRGWKPYRLAKEAGVSPTTITRLLNDPNWKFVPKLDTLAKIATAAGLELPDVLRATSGSPRALSGRVPVLGAVQAGAWRAIPEEPEIDEWLQVDVPEYAGAELFALQVAGRSMDLIYPAGTYVICVPPAQAGLKEGDCVVVQRRDGADRVETTLKEVQRGGDGTIVLRPRSSDPAHQVPIIVPVNRAEVDIGVVIIGVVVSTYRKERRGTGPLLDF